MLGDGIEQIAIDSLNRIWVSWFDEGTHGNERWKVPGVEWSPSTNGIACFGHDGSLIEVPSWPEHACSIVDCYALAVSGSDAWASPYKYFPLVQFVSGKPPRWWQSRLDGPTAIAIDYPHALVAGGYGAEGARLVLVRLGGSGTGEEAAHLAKWRMPLRHVPSDEKDGMRVWAQPALLLGRGDTLHLIDDDRWFRWRVSDAVTAQNGA